MLALRRASIALLVVAVSGITAYAVEGVKGTVSRPREVPAKVKGCKIADQTPFACEVGDAIELDYSYPVVPGAIPNKVSTKQTPGGAVDVSPLGIRMVVAPGLVGASTIGFFFDAKKKGQETVTIVIDDYEYQYTITVN
jgi:hypothetical protein